MYTRQLAVFGAALLVVACDGNTSAPTAPTADAGAQYPASYTSAQSPAIHNMPEQQDRPLKGSCELTVEVLSVNFPIVRQRDTGACQLTHLGRTQFDGILEINVLVGTQTGTRTFTAANGDELHASVQGTSSPIGSGLIAFSATFTFTGGTGRFANASGTAPGNGVANQVTRTSLVSLAGQIRY